MPRKIIFGKELRINCSQTINLLNRAVSPSLGPSGKFGLLDRPAQKNSLITKDGVTICRLCLPLADEVMNLIATKVLEIANKTNAESGDGTTTSIVLANALFHEAIKFIESGIDPVKVRDEIEEILPFVLKELDKMAIPIKTIEDVANVATVSANNDREIGELIAKAVDSVGQDGFVTLTEGEKETPTLDVTEGMQLDKGPASERYLKGQPYVEFTDANILIIDGKIELQETLNDLYTQVAGRPFVIIGELSLTAQEYLMSNSRVGQIDCVHILPKFQKGMRVKFLHDIATAVGAQVIDPHNFDFAGSISADVLGRAKKVTFNRFHTNIVEGYGKKEDILERVELLKQEMELTNSQYEQNGIRERIGKLTCGTAVIGVGGRTDDEVLERRDRFEDSLNSARSALLEGIVPGGGFALLDISRRIKGDSIGAKIFRKVLRAPLKQIVKNTGVSPQEVINQLIPKESWLAKYVSKAIFRHSTTPFVLNQGYNAKTRKYENLVQTGIVDPVKSTKSGLKNAVSIVDLLINLEVLTVDILDKDNAREMLNAMKGINADDI